MVECDSQVDGANCNARTFPASAARPAGNALCTDRTRVSLDTRVVATCAGKIGAKA